MTDKDFLKFIKKHSYIGFGRMIQIISYAWYMELKRKFGDGIENGAFTGICIGRLRGTAKKEYFGILEQEIKDGMNY